MTTDDTTDTPAVDLCDAASLLERARAHVWDIDLRGEPATAFALRIDGRVVAYVNRCVHVAAEMDWNPGEFLDRSGLEIVCSLHGASYDPASGRCLGGPCGRGVLEPLDVREEGARVRWYPSAGLAPVRRPAGTTPP
jgi:nitrite reductase/ring-hydroxylating ferredoxin subunit